MTLKITKNYFQTIIASTSSDEGKIKLADMAVSINHTSDLLQMEEDSQRKGKNIQGVYFMILLCRDYVRILIPRGLLVMDFLFLLLFSLLNPQIPGGLKPFQPPL